MSQASKGRAIGQMDFSSVFASRKAFDFEKELDDHLTINSKSPHASRQGEQSSGRWQS
jgi:hypothetical protein